MHFDLQNNTINRGIKTLHLLYLNSLIFRVKAQDTETSTVDEPALYIFTQVGIALLFGSFMFMFVMILSVRAIRKQIKEETERRGGN